jgi:mRNA interferase MazF
MVISQYDAFLINLDPTIGQEIKKTRLCLTISPNEMNANVSTLIVPPMTTKFRDYPTRVGTTVKRKSGWIVLERIRAVDKKRRTRRLGQTSEPMVWQVRAILSEIPVE